MMMINEDEFIRRSPPFYKDGTIVLLKTSTDTLKLLNPNANALMLGDATHEGGDIKVYRDASGNLQLSVNADAASNGEALVVYGGVVCQNLLTVGQATLQTGYVGYFAGNIRGTAAADFASILTRSNLSCISNQSTLLINIPVTGTDSTNHNLSLQVDSNSIIDVQATGDGAGGISNPAIGLYPGTTPTTQAAHIADPAESIAANNTAIDAILVALENIGVLASS